MSAPVDDPNQSQPVDHRATSNESLGVGDAVADQQSEPSGELDSPLNDDLAPPGSDSDSDGMPD